LTVPSLQSSEVHLETGQSLKSIGIVEEASFGNFWVWSKSYRNFMRRKRGRLL